MSASATPPASYSRFSQQELDMLAKTADAMSAYLGQPVLAEVAAGEEGMEWVTFGVPLDAAQEPDEERLHVQLGGSGARLLGQRGGLPDSAEAYDCLYLWAIQISAAEGERFVKLDQDGEEAAWSDMLADVLPFSLEEEPLPDPDEDEDEEEDEDDEDDDAQDAGRPGVPRG